MAETSTDVPPRADAPTTTGIAPAERERAAELVGRLVSAFDAHVVGQDRVRTALLVSLVAEGHVLLESVPGLAKTLAASTLARAVAADFARIQCTPDLLPSDIIGTQVYDPRTHTSTPSSARSTPTWCCSTRSTGPAPRPSRRCSRRCRSGRRPSPARCTACRAPSWCWPPRTRSTTRAPTSCPQAQMDRFLLKEVVDYPAHAAEVEVLERLDRGTSAPTPPSSPPWRRPRTCSSCRSRPAGLRRRRREALRGRPRPRHPRRRARAGARDGRDRRGRGEPARHHRLPARSPRPSPCCRGATTSSPRTCASCGTPCCATAMRLSFEADGGRVRPRPSSTPSSTPSPSP